MLLAAKNIPIIRLRPGTKIPIDQAWQNLATTDVDKILAWDKETPNAGVAAVAKSDGVLFFESDVEDTVERYQNETGEIFPETYVVQSRPGRLHFYFTQTAESRACGSITQQQIPFGSLRQNNSYVVGAGSIHEVTGEPYTVVQDVPLVPIPTKFLEWLKSQVKRLEETRPSLTGSDPIPFGSHDSTLTAIAGRLRSDGLEEKRLNRF